MVYEIGKCDVKNYNADRDAIIVLLLFSLLGWGLLLREAISAGDLYARYIAFRDHAACAAVELRDIDPDNETARAVIAAVERDVDPMEER